MEKPDTSFVCFCPLDGILDTISKKWSLMIIAVVGNTGSMGFNEIKRYLAGVSSKTLSASLKELESKDLITRTVMNTSPPSVKYSLTDSGSELRNALVPILGWVEKRGGHPKEGCPIHIHNDPNSSVI